MVPAAFIAVSNDALLDGNEALSVDTPREVEPGDTLLAALCVGDSLSVASMPAGWDTLLTLASGTLRFVLMRRIATAGEPDTHDFVLSGPGSETEPLLSLLVYRGLDPHANVIASGIVAVSASTTFDPPPAGLVNYSDLALLIHYAALDVTFTPSAGTTERIDFLAGVPETAVMVADHHKEATGSTGSLPATASSSASGFAAVVILKSDELPTADLLMLDPPGAIGLPAAGI